MELTAKFDKLFFVDRQLKPWYDPDNDGRGELRGGEADRIRKQEADRGRSVFFCPRARI